MQPTIVKEIITLVLLAVFIAAFYLSISPMVYLLGYTAVFAMFVIFAVSLVTKTDRDEREAAHRSTAAEAGFIIGGFMLLLAIAHQTFVMQHADPWLFAILVAMLLGRLVVRWYLDKKS